MQLYDQLNRTLEFSNTPKRIVSLVPSQTELLVSLGLETSILGITKFCVHPPHLRSKKTVVGGTKNCNFEKIAALTPDIIICNKEENTLTLVEQCEKIAPTYVSDINTIDDSLEFILAMGTLISVENTAQQLVDSTHAKLEDFKLFMANKREKKVAYFIWQDPWMVAASNTFIHELLEHNKFINVFEDQVRYPAIELDQLRTLNVDLILLSSEPYPFKEKHFQEIQKYSSAKVVLVNGEYFSWYGSRLLEAFDYFKSLH